MEPTGDNLIQNNIIQKSRTGITFDGADAGSVMAYNYIVNDIYPSDAMFAGIFDHATGDDFHLWEGNVTAGFDFDLYHGTHLNETAFRNFSTGWESCGSGQCGTFPGVYKDWGTIALYDAAFNRYANIIGNVLGTPGYHTTYLGPCAGNRCIYQIGAGNPGYVPDDALTLTTSMRWGNYDTVNNAVQWNPAEVPSAISPYANAVPAAQALPASFYSSSMPSWWGSTPWPAIGPDVGNGNVGLCSGTLNTLGEFAGLPATSNSQCTGTSLTSGWAGHVNAIPAMRCYLSLGGLPDGTGGALNFNADTCYGSGSSTTAAVPARPAGLLLR